MCADSIHHAHHSKQAVLILIQFVGVVHAMIRL